MKTISRNWPSIVLSCIVLVSGLAACGGGGTKEGAAGADGGKATDTATPGPTKYEPVELTVYSAPGDSEQAWNERFGDPIRKKYPHISFKYINPRGNDALKIGSLLATGTSVDIYYESIGGFFVSVPENKLQFDLTPLIAKNKLDLSNFEPTLIDVMKTNAGGQIWGLPVNNNNMVMYYNKDIFDKFGVEYPKDGMTWDDAIALSQKLNRNDGEKRYVGLAASPGHTMRMNAFSQPFVDPKTDKATFGDDIWKKMVQTFFVQPSVSEEYKNTIRELGNKLPYANEFNGSHILAQYVHQSNLPFIDSAFKNTNFNMVSLPTFKEKPGIGSQPYPTFFAIPTNSKQKDQAFLAIQYLVSPEYQLEYSKKGVMPVLKDDKYKAVFATETGFKDINFKAVFYNKFAPIPAKTKYDGIAEKAMVSQLVDLSLGNTDLNSVIRKADEESAKNIATEKSK